MIRAGIIGLGVGEAHIEGYNNSPNCQVVAICDFDQEALDQVARKHPGIRTTVRAEELLSWEDIDVVSIASFDSYHHAQIMMAIEAGKHLFVEKPLCLYRHEAEEIWEALKKNPQIKLSSNLILRQSARFIDLKSRIHQGDLGDLFYIKGAYNYGRLHKIVDGWRSKEPFYSAVYGGGVHIIDLILWLSNLRVTEVAAFGNDLSSRNSSFPNFDLVSSLLQFENGATGQMTVNFGCVHPHFHQMEVYGSQGTFLNGQETATLYNNRDTMEAVSLHTPYPGVKKGDLIHDFIEAIREDRSPCVSVQEIFDTLAVCFAIEEAAHSRQTQRVQYLT